MADLELIPVEERPAVLAVAGLDPSGGAGITVDAAVIRAFGLHPVTALTAVAVENTARVARRHDLTAALLAEELAVLAEEFLLGAVKTGMLAGAGLVEVVAAWLAERPRLPLVLDPVLRATNGGALGDPDLTAALTRHLLPRARVFTPNLAEAAAFTGRLVTDRDELPDLARALRDLGPEWVLVKGGHFSRGRASDYLLGPGVEVWLEDDRLPRDARGTGCALASAIACALTRGAAVPDACREAKAFVSAGIASGYVTGEGRFLAIPPTAANG